MIWNRGIKFSMNEKIKLSFCIPTYNRAQRVYDCVKHILQYAGDDIEVVVSNNASTDNTLELLSTIRDERLVIHTNEENIFSLNWPLAVSRANGQWAVIMSDEDIVNLDAIQYYIHNLLDPEIGMIIYSFPPVINAISYTYKCKSQCESIYNAIKFCGHITGVIYNMSRNKIKHLSYYNDLIPSRDVSLDPLVKIAIENAIENNSMMTEMPICYYGSVESKVTDIKKKGSVVLYKFAGYEADNKMRMLYSYTYYIENNVVNPPVSLYNAVLRRVLCLVGIFYGNVMTYKSAGPDSVIWDAAREKYGCERKPIVEDLMKYFKIAVQHIVDIAKKESWNKYIAPAEQCFNQDYSSALPSGLQKYESIMIGDTLFSIILQFYRNFDPEAKLPDEYFADDFGDSLCMKSREIMRKHMREKDYNSVISLNAPDSIRTRYYKGEAYFHKNDFDKAAECFNYVLEKTLDPKVLDDILINEIAVQYSLFYMAVISKRQNDNEKAEQYLAVCHELSEELLINANLASPNLPAY